MVALMMVLRQDLAYTLLELNGFARGGRTSSSKERYTGQMSAKPARSDVVRYRMITLWVSQGIGFKNTGSALLCFYLSVRDLLGLRLL